MTDYIGNLIDDVFLDSHIVAESENSNTVPSMLFFYKKYNVYPCSIIVHLYENNNYPSKHVYQVLKDEYKHENENDIIIYNYKSNCKYVLFQLCDLGDGVMLQLKGDLRQNLSSTTKIEHFVENFHHVFYGIEILYKPEKQDFVEKLNKELKRVVMKNTTEKSLQMICKNLCCFYLTSIKIKKPIITDLKLHYGEEFEKVHNTIVNALKSESSHGLILLHGLPGSGKTHYIRYLIQEITDKKLIYIPPDMTSSISTPEFFPFMLQNTNSILIIEDAENIIKSRDSKETTTQAVANLLNLSDGLLGDSLHQPIIATFNCDVNSIDPALLRKGRLITQYEFGKLSIENSQKLSNELGFKTTITEPMTLADIYGQEK